MNEAELLFSEILGCDRTSLYLNRSLGLDKNKASLISSVLKRRIKGEPIQYILGKAEFFGLEFKVNKDVLIPRPETEILVEKVLKLAAGRPPAGEAGRLQDAGLKILDIGTGSGNIAISLAKYLQGALISATDISEGALRIAEGNARLHNVKVNFLKSDLFPSNPSLPAPYHLIISNPPYIPAAEINQLHPEVRNEPRMALDGGKDGLDFYRRIISRAPSYLEKQGYLVMEFGFGQRREIENIFQKNGNFEIIEVVRDYNDIDRMVIGQRKNG